MDEYKYFKDAEFQFCTPPCRLHHMNPDFMSRLDHAREVAGVPFMLNSAYRTVNWEIKQGRAGTSSHTKGLAVDIDCLTPSHRFRILTALIQEGFTRIGIYPSFIHVDADPDKDPAIWYSSKNTL